MRNIVSCSFGKDSLAQIVVMKELDIPIDDIIFCDIRFDRNISGEHPMLAEWIPTAESILKTRYGLKVTHISSEKTFTEHFYTVKEYGGHKGDIYGFPYTMGAWCNSRLKTNVIRKYLSNIPGNITQFVGLAYDEPERYMSFLKRNTGRIENRSVLYEQKITEIEAYGICRRCNLLSPHYSLGGFRGGCWFCVKQSYADLYNLWIWYPEMFYRLLEMEKDSFNEFSRNTSLSALEKRFRNGFVPRYRCKNSLKKEDFIYEKNFYGKRI